MTLAVAIRKCEKKNPLTFTSLSIHCNILPFKNWMRIDHMLNKLLHIGSAQGYTYDTQVIMKYCYISMWEIENGELIKKTFKF